MKTHELRIAVVPALLLLLLLDSVSTTLLHRFRRTGPLVPTEDGATGAEGAAGSVRRRRVAEGGSTGARRDPGRKLVSGGTPTGGRKYPFLALIDYENASTHGELHPVSPSPTIPTNRCRDIDVPTSFIPFSSVCILSFATGALLPWSDGGERRPVDANVVQHRWYASSPASLLPRIVGPSLSSVLGWLREVNVPMIVGDYDASSVLPSVQFIEFSEDQQVLTSPDEVFMLVKVDPVTLFGFAPVPISYDTSEPRPGRNVTVVGLRGQHFMEW